MEPNSAARASDVNVLNWTQWQGMVLALLHADGSGALGSIRMEEVDWDAWRAFYIEGRSPRSAIDRALARDY